MIITRSDIFLHILFTSIHVSVCVCLLIRWSISTFVYLCDCGKFPLPSPSVAFVRKHGDWQSAFSMIYTFAQVESSVWISFNKLLNSRLAKKYFDTRRHFDETQENWLRQNCPTGQPVARFYARLKSGKIKTLNSCFFYTFKQKKMHCIIFYTLCAITMCKHRNRQTIASSHLFSLSQTNLLLITKTDT